MPIKKYNRKTNTFYIIKPKLVHIGSINTGKNKKHENLTQNDKYKVAAFVNKLEYFGIEFGVKTILSFSDYDIFKIRDDIELDKSKVNQMNIKKEKFKKTNSIDIIRKQLGLK